MPAQDIITIPSLVIGGREVVPVSSVSREILAYGTQPCLVYPVAPTLATARHAFFDRNPDGSCVCPEYRENVLGNKGKGEWFSTYLRDGKKAIVPERLFLHPMHGWVAEGSEQDVELPRIESEDRRWVLEYDKPTGFPSSVGTKKEAQRVFGEDASRFWYNPNGLRAVCRFYGADYGPFFVGAGGGPDDRGDYLGVRLASRLSNTEGVATPQKERKFVVEFGTEEELRKYLAAHRSMGEFLSRAKIKE